MGFAPLGTIIPITKGLPFVSVTGREGFAGERALPAGPP